MLHITPAHGDSALLLDVQMDLRLSGQAQGRARRTAGLATAVLMPMCWM
jgi:hypothetical protein